MLAPITFALPVFAAPNRTPAATPVPKGSAAHYETAVQPLLAARCGGCHLGPLVRGGLSVADAGHLRAGGHGGPAVQPGRPEESLLYRVLAEGRMPQGGRRFSPRELELVANWIRDGARTRATPGGHWAYQPLPVVSTAPAIDAMLQHRLRRLGLALSPEAAKRDLLRRLSFSLTGLPPTPSELEEFERDGSPEAYARQVERLLASEHYGERWARHWLDPAGYADSEGVLQEDRLRPNAWMYRDSVIRALNADKPLDEFIREQIAGDELVHYKTVPRFTPQIIDTLALTGFLRTPVDATRADFNARQYGEYQYRMVNDLQTILSSSLLGLTIQCARCHNHKYEPITQKDYYAFQAIFTGAVRPRGAILPSADRQIVAATAAEQAQAVRTNGEVDAALREIAKREEELTRARQAKSIQDGERPTDPAERIALAAAAGRPDGARSPAEKQLIEKLKSLIPSKETLLKADPEFARQMQSLLDERQSQEKRRIQLTSIRAFYDVDAAPPPTPLLARGEWLKPVEPVEPGVPAFLSRLAGHLPAPKPVPGAGSTGRRSALAEWLVRPSNPLTARVLVNRVWYHHFGEGLCPSLDNLGQSGEQPTHPDLLNALAGWFVRPRSEGGAGWSLKALHRLILLSRAYRQSTTPTTRGNRADPANRLLWRQRPRRLDADALRDAILAVSGTLDRRLFGPPVPLETRVGGEVAPAGDENGGRRSLYLTIRRSTPVHLLAAFDAPIMETNCSRRAVTTTAVQSLALLNGGFVKAQAARFAARIEGEEGSTSGDGERIQTGFLLALTRAPSVEEREEAERFLAEQAARYSRLEPNRAGEARSRALADFCQTLLCSNEFAYLD